MQQHQPEERRLRILRLLAALGESSVDSFHSVLDRAGITGWGTLLPELVGGGLVEQAPTVFGSAHYQLTPAGRAAVDRDLHTPCPLCGRS